MVLERYIFLKSIKPDGAHLRIDGRARVSALRGRAKKRKG